MIAATPPGLEFAFEAHADLGTPIQVGQVAHGERRIIPVLGGTFAGPAVQGRILNGGADWQIIRADGVIELDARYTLETSTGAIVYVVNQGMRHGPAGQYFRAVPRFETSAPELQWMVKSIFLCVGERLASEVNLRFWRVL